MTTIINLYGGPGTGKTTSASYLFYLFKSIGMNAELVREYVKEWAWEGRHIGQYDQAYFMGKQIRRESLLFGRTDFIVTDSPVYISQYYAEKYSPEFLLEGIEAMVGGYYKQSEFDGHRHLHVFLKRTKPYVSAGRYQTFEEAKDIDEELKSMLADIGVPFTEYGTTEDELKRLFFDLTGKKL